MAAARYAVVEIAAQEILLKLYEISAKSGIQTVDTIRRSIPIGRETYVLGKISADVLEKICDVLNSFSGIIREYRVEQVRCVATSAVRDAKNCSMILDQIRVRTGFEVAALSNSEQRFLRLKGAASQSSVYQLLEKGTLFVDIGSGSLQVSVFDKMTLMSTQNISLGTGRLDEMYSAPNESIGTMEGIVKELIDNDIHKFEKMFLKDREIKNVIIVGDGLVSYLRRCLEREAKGTPTVEDFGRFYQKISGKSAAELSRILEIPVEYASMITTSVLLYQALLEASKADTVCMPKSDLCDGVVLDVAERKKMIRAQHDFNEDILAASQNICRRYMGNKKHALATEKVVCQIFDAIRKYHGLGSRERLLLQIAALLHDCGQFISMSTPGDCSYHIIMSTEILGLSDVEREIVANIVRYNTLEFPSYEEIDGKLSMEDYLVVMKLAAILRVGNAIDRSHKQKFDPMKLTLKGSTLVITTGYEGDIMLEKSILDSKSRFFEEVYGIRLQVKQKRN